jgi:hypothetical protein
MANQNPNVEQLRAAIDSGRTGDKVAYPDPAAAPLGADDEAAGTPPAPSAIRQTMARETSRRRQSRSRPDQRGFWILIGLMVVIGVALAIGYLA